MVTNLPETEIWLGLTEAAQKLGVTPVTLRRWADQGAVSHMITPGGHRRFAVADVEQFTEERKRVSPAALNPERLWAEIALKQTRTEIISRREERWLVAFDGKDRERKRLLGRELMGLLLRYVSLDKESKGILEEVRVIGRAHATNALELGLPLTTVIQAVMFFRDTLVEAAVDLPATNRVRPIGSKRLLRRINTLLNAVQLAIVEVYDARISSLD